MLARLLSLAAVATALPSLSFVQGPVVLPDGPKKTLFIKVCSGCHQPEAVPERMDTLKNWARQVDRMIDRGAQAKPEEIVQINAYLNRNFGFVASQVHLPDGPGKELGKESADPAIPPKS